MGEHIVRGGGDTERLYEHDAEFTLTDGHRLVVSRSNMPKALAGMADVFARSLARYGLLAMFCRPGHRLLDAPCGSGYAAPFLAQFGVDYTGVDIDQPTIEYATHIYGQDRVRFCVGDLVVPDFGRHTFNVIGCIEGLEHIEQRFQAPLLSGLHRAVIPGGVVLVSSPEPTSGSSGPSEHNRDHKWELSFADFAHLLRQEFGEQNVELLSQRRIMLSTGVATTCHYAVCHCDL